jgi:membrane-associated phospholipid phosphatase
MLRFVSQHRLAAPARLLRRAHGRELGVFVLAYLLYSAGRFVAIGDVDTATANAHDILRWEQSLSVDVEQGVQEALHGSWLLWLLNHVYLAAQLVVVPGVLVWLYRRSPSHYRVLRNTILATWLIALPIYALFPVAPPRLAGIGLIDTITSQTGVALDSKLTTSMYNEYAAVPSLHAGFALAVSAALAAAAGARRWKVVAWLWAPLVALSVVATGNHFMADIAAGVVVTLTGHLAGRWLQRRWDERAQGRPSLVRPQPCRAPAG